MSTTASQAEYVAMPHQQNQYETLSSTPAPRRGQEIAREQCYPNPLARCAWDRYNTAEAALNPHAQTFDPITGTPGQEQSVRNIRSRMRRINNPFHSQFYGVTERPIPYPTIIFRGPPNAEVESTTVIASSQPTSTLSANLLDPGSADPIQQEQEQSSTLRISHAHGFHNDGPEYHPTHNADPGFNGDGPNAIDLQERPEPLNPEQMKVDISCKVCQEQIIDTIVEPCNHFVMCHWCAQAMEATHRQQQREQPWRKAEHRCPLCRTNIDGTRRVHIA